MNFSCFFIFSFLIPVIFTRVADVQNNKAAYPPSGDEFLSERKKFQVGLTVKLKIKPTPSIFDEQSLHLSLSEINQEDSKCFWSGTAPFCDGHCGKGYRPTKVDKVGDGKYCWTGMKKYCCQLKKWSPLSNEDMYPIFF